LEYCPNGELLDLIKKAGRFDEVAAKFYAAELLNGLEYMHNNNVIHRDIKPENILLDPDFHSKISDFGTAQTVSKDKDGNVFLLHALIFVAKVTNFAGTPEYCAPELITDKWAGRMYFICLYKTKNL
jgi:serine/threonine protein kinase